MSISLGIDFGTTNTAAALHCDGKTRVLALGNGPTPEMTLRSIIFISPNDEVFFGQKALDVYLNSELPATDRAAIAQFSTIDDKGNLRIWEEGLAAYLAQQPKKGRVMQSFKSFLSSPQFLGVLVNGKRYEIEDLIAVLLGYVKHMAEHEAGEPLTTVTLGRPVLFSENPERDALAERRLVESARRAGFTSISVQKEPIAACLSYMEHLSEGSTKRVLVGDFGGGTSDFTVVTLNRKKSGSSFVVRATGGVYIGGDTFNGRIMRDVVASYFGKDVTHQVSSSQRAHLPYWLTAGLCEWHKLPFMNDRSTLDSIKKIRMTADDKQALDRLQYLITSNKGYNVHRAIDDAKVTLSAQEEATVAYTDEVLQVQEKLERTLFDRLITQDVEILEHCIVQTIADAQVNARELDGVLLTGGTAFVPAVRAIFQRLFPNVPIIQLDAFTSVAAGLAAGQSIQEEPDGRTGGKPHNA